MIARRSKRFILKVAFDNDDVIIFDRLPSSIVSCNRELKQRRRRRQRQRHKTIGLMSKNNRSVRAFYILVHFFAVFCKTTT